MARRAKQPVCRLRIIMAEREINSLEELAGKTKVSVGALSMISRGADCRIATARKLMTALKVPADEIWPWLGRYRKEK